MTSIWSSTNRENIRHTMRVPVDISATGTPGHVEAHELVPDIRSGRRLRHWHAKLGGALHGLNDARILCVGDSTTFGSYSTGVNTGEQVEHSYPTALKNLFAGTGFNAHANSVIGWGNGGENSYNNDGRVGGTGATQSPDWTIGGGAFTLVSPNTLSFTPDQDVDTFVIYTIGWNGEPDLDYDIDGGATTTVPLTAPSDQLNTPIVVNTTLGSHTLNMTPNSAGNLFILGVEAYDSTKQYLHIINVGAAGSKASDWIATGKPWSPVNSWDYYSPDLILLSLGTNEWVSGDSVATYKSNMQTLIDGIVTTGGIDIALVTPAPSDAGSASIATQDSFVDAIYELANDNDLLVIDNYARFIDYTTSNAAGMYGHVFHPRDLGYADFALGIYKAIGV